MTTPALRAAVAALNKGEPLALQAQSRLAVAFDALARDLAGLGPAHRESVRGGFFARLGGRR